MAFFGAATPSRLSLQACASWLLGFKVLVWHWKSVDPPCLVPACSRALQCVHLLPFGNALHRGLSLLQPSRLPNSSIILTILLQDHFGAHDTSRNCTAAIENHKTFTSLSISIPPFTADHGTRLHWPFAASGCKQDSITRSTWLSNAQARTVWASWRSHPPAHVLGKKSSP